MKYLFFSALIIFGFSSCSEQNASTTNTNDLESEELKASEVVTNPNTANPEKQDETPAGFAKIKWDENTHNFGKMYPGEKKSHIFKFKNTGNIPLIIEDATASCGCTIPEKPKKPIPPGEEGHLTVSFTKTTPGEHKKQVTVNTNADPAQHFLHITATVIDEGSKED